MSATVRGRVLRDARLPLAWLSGGALMVVASDRLAHALVVAVALVWIRCLSAVAIAAAGRFLPECGRTAVLALVATFAAALFLFLLWLAFPLAALQVFFAVSLVPMFCAVSGLPEAAAGVGPLGVLRPAAGHALRAGAPVAALALVREPVGFGSLSLPGGAGGLVLFHPFGADSPLFAPVSGAFGALVLLGYGLWMYRHLRSRGERGEGDG